MGNFKWVGRAFTANIFLWPSLFIFALLYPGDAKFVSVTYRLFKLPADKEEGRQVIYNGEISGYTQELAFDLQNKFKVNRIKECVVKTYM